jgi:hypothetical protein
MQFVLLLKEESIKKNNFQTQATTVSTEDFQYTDYILVMNFLGS